MQRTLQISLFNHLMTHYGERFDKLRTTKATLVHISHTLEDLILRQKIPALLFTGFQESTHWREETRRYRELAGIAQQVCIFGGGTFPPESHAAQINVPLAEDDPLRQEWFVCILSDRFTVLLCGLDQHSSEDGDEATREFLTLWTFEPQLVNDVLDLLQDVVAHYRPERAQQLRDARLRFSLSSPDPQIVTAFTRELISFEERILKRMRTSEARYRAIIEDQTELLCRFTPDGALNFLNPAYQRYFDLDKTPRDRSFFDTIIAVDRPAVAHALARIDASLPLGTIECRVMLADDHTRWLQWTVRAIFHTTDKQHEFQAVGRDITAQRQAEAALQHTNAELTTRVTELQARTHEINELSELGELLQASRDVAEAGQVFRRCARRLFPAYTGRLLLLDDSQQLQPVASWGTARNPETLSPDACWALRRGRAHLVDTIDDELRCANCRRSASEAALCVPMIARGEALGILQISWDLADQSGVRGGSSLQRLVTAVAEQTAMALANIQLRDRLRQQVIRDQLTGLFNRRYLEETLGREISRALRHGNSLGLMMVDIDHFKEYNDRYGHGVGDLVLRAVGAFLKNHLRVEDIACRYGGEEFVLILPESTPDQSFQRAEVFREAISHLTVPSGDQRLNGITISIGIACTPHHATLPDALLRAADVALYNAKAAGRNCVVMGNAGV